MFEEIRLFGGPNRIALQTRKKRDIPNLIESEPGPEQIAKFQRLAASFGAQWEVRKPPAGGYNCAGHVWASRRTSILEPAQCWSILDDDGYRHLTPHDVPFPGDLALYLDLDRSRSESLLHVSEVVSMVAGVANGAPPIARVLSKWDSTSGEVLHLVHHVPFRRQGFRYDWEFWTDRPHVRVGA